KFGYPTAQGPNEQGQSRKWIIQSVDASLKRLGTDYIDILYFHRALAEAPLNEGVRAIGDLIRQGKIRYFGVSNFRGWRIAEIARLADQLGIDRPVASEPLYNLVVRTAEVEQLPAAAHYGLGVVSYSPLARGVLSGKMRSMRRHRRTRAQAAATSGSSRPSLDAGLYRSGLPDRRAAHCLKHGRVLKLGLAQHDFVARLCRRHDLILHDGVRREPRGQGGSVMLDHPRRGLARQNRQRHLKSGPVLSGTGQHWQRRCGNGHEGNRNDTSPQGHAPAKPQGAQATRPPPARAAFP